MAKIAPLNTGFLVTGMIGFAVSVLYVPQFSATWAFAFSVVFVIMFVASMISMVRGSPDEQLYPRQRRIK